MQIFTQQQAVNNYGYNTAKNNNQTSAFTDNVYKNGENTPYAAAAPVQSSINKNGGTENGQGGNRIFADGFKKGECHTCENRKYQDGSNDSSVSFQSPTKISPESAASAVRGHEAEHVSHEQTKAKMEGKKVISQSVQIHTGICPECGRVYISGGTTRTVTKTDNAAEKYKQQMQQQSSGKVLDATA